MWTRCLAILAIAILGMAVTPHDARSQTQSPAEVVAAMGLEQRRVGRVVVHYAPGDEDRAIDMASLVDAAAAMFDGELGLGFSVSLAALGPSDWFSEYPDIPYAIPWVSVEERLLILPSSLEVGVLASGPDRLANQRRTDFVALHEYGHVAAKEFFGPTSSERDPAVPWFNEFLATYFAYSFVSAVDPQWAQAARDEWRGQVDGFEPTVRSLDWSYMYELSGPAVAQEYGWYQFLLNLRAADVHDRHGIGLLRQLEAVLDWTEADTWTSASLLQALETTVPDLVEWARSFGDS